MGLTGNSRAVSQEVVDEKDLCFSLAIGGRLHCIDDGRDRRCVWSSNGRIRRGRVPWIFRSWIWSFVRFATGVSQQSVCRPRHKQSFLSEPSPVFFWLHRCRIRISVLLGPRLLLRLSVRLCEL